MLLTVGFIYLLYVYNQNLPRPGRPQVKAPASGRLVGQDWPPKFGDQQRLPDMNGGVTDGAVISGAADNEEHNAAAEEEQQDKQKIAANDMDFDGGDSNNAVENRVEEEGAAADKEAKRGDKSSVDAGNLAAIIRDKSVADAAGVKAEGEDVLPPADGSLIFEGPQVMNTEKETLVWRRLFP
jgi:hypothetical protein